MSFHVLVRRWTPPVQPETAVYCRTLRRAQEVANTACARPGDAASIWHVGRGRQQLVTRYWKDASGLQYLDY